MTVSAIFSLSPPRAVGSREAATSPGTPAMRRGTTQWPVRIDQRTSSARRAASTEMSAADCPEPTTSTRLPSRPSAPVHSLACMTCTEEGMSSAHSGRWGRSEMPCAEMTAR